MTDENKILELREECFCKSKWFKKFITISLGTFVGVFCGLSLFAALHKPPMPPCPLGYGKVMRPPMHCNHHYMHHKNFKGDYYHKKMMQNRIAPDKVKVEVKN